jgi:N6-adenosine-specific RNA methylase IME4
MSKTDGITRSRWKKESYKGFSIIGVCAVQHWYNNYQKRYEMSRQYETKRETYYEFCKEGDENSPSKAYTPYPYVKTIEDIQKCIDNFIKDDSIYFTDAEREKYVYKPNKKCDWGYGYDSLMKLLKEHKKATKRMRILIEDRLDDANFHYESGLLSQQKYDELEEYITNEYQFREKFEIITSTKRGRIKDPENLTEIINCAIFKALLDAGIKDTSISVKFIKEW